MVGSLLYHDLLLSGRRNHLHYLRWVYAAWLIFILLCLEFLGQGPAYAIGQFFRNGTVGSAVMHGAQVIGAQFAGLFIEQQSLLLFLLTPIFAAGAIVEEKRHGTLQMLLLGEVEP